MDIIDKGHKYLLNDNKQSSKTTTITFFKDPKINGNGYNGTTNQEVLRVVIDRIKFLDKQVHSEYNDKILYHLRMVLVLHECRHLERLVGLGNSIELIQPTNTGHFL